MRKWSFLTVATAGGLLAAIGAAQADLVHATWGGGGAITLREAVAEPFAKATGIGVTVAEVPNTAGVVRSPTASQYDAVTVTFFEAAGMADQGLLETFEDSDIPGLADLPPDMVVRDSAGKVVGLTAYFAFYGIAINTDYVSRDDFKSWNDLADPKWKGRLAVTRAVYSAPYDLTMFAYANGGDSADVEPGMASLKGLIANSLTTYTSMAHMNTLLTSGEAVAAPYYSSRVWHMREEGLKNIEIAVPEEGALILPYVVVVPKGSANKADVAKYLDYLLRADVQVNLSVSTGNIPASNKAQLPATFEESFGMTRDDMISRMINPDWSRIVEHYEERTNAVEQMMAQ